MTNPSQPQPGDQWGNDGENGQGWNSAGQGWNQSGQSWPPQANGYGHHAQAGDGVGHGSYPQQPGSNVTQDVPENYLVWTILATILCCLPLGAVGIYFSTRVDKYLREGKLREATDASRKAKMFALFSVGIVVVVFLVYLLLAAIGIVAQSASSV